MDIPLKLKEVKKSVKTHWFQGMPLERETYNLVLSLPNGVPLHCIVDGAGSESALRDYLKNPKQTY